MFDIAVTLKYDQGHSQWHEQVKLSEWYCHVMFGVYHIYGSPDVVLCG